MRSDSVDLPIVVVHTHLCEVVQLLHQLHMVRYLALRHVHLGSKEGHEDLFFRIIVMMHFGVKALLVPFEQVVQLPLLRDGVHAFEALFNF